ncbi:aminotransferase class III-fold pyridoxal phosphate-dependent enzyme [Microbispora triticiradicis]|uniref:Aminotransferase class III-fold pyridoxal phosphate-dependent enzyme n=3 Tax=Microbispora TaxID=2005 RepID=A0ABY3LSH9_9ACTN|nr:aminotransferase class III-fold pyridoxal phosphate-dependent enzyme [Microbispora triticiradicis]TLP54813.1 aminotransferase class III-fold pyridoxal phosphate-dependent enzyme [Microbispora fusca]TYB50738.1 aminotransferase class III-fold pyridoxal phosphate-dependent enzyme [Microbispora tritici]
MKLGARSINSGQGGSLSKHERIAHSKITRKFKSAGQQLLFSQGKRGEVSDANGVTYTDFVMGYGPVILGHSDDQFSEILSRYLVNGVMMPGYTTFHQEYLERLLGDRPKDRGAYFKTASEAVTAAFRLAAMRTGRLGVVRSGYIGWHDAQIANSLKWHEPLHSPLREKLRYTDAMRGIGETEPAANWVDLRLESLAELLDRHKGLLGCFVFDAYLASFTTPEVLRQAVAMCREAGLLTVFDETKTGGRISPLGYDHDNRLGSDLIVIGKALANGAPLSLLVGDAELLAQAERARLSGTFSKEMIAVYAALATRDILEKPVGDSPDGWAEIGRIGTQVASVFTAAAQDAGVGSLVGARPVLGGGMFELVYHDDTLLGDKERREALLAALTGAGILLLEGHPSFVSLAHRDTDWADLHDRARQAFEEWNTSAGAGRG